MTTHPATSGAPAHRVAARYRDASPVDGRGQAMCTILTHLLETLDQAAVADREQRFEDEWEAVKIAVDIIQSLDDNLDMEAGAGVARSLRGSYRSAIRALHALVRVREGAEGYLRVRAGFVALREAWASVLASGQGVAR